MTEALQVNVHLLKKAIREGVNEMVQAEAHKEEITTICSNAEEKVGLTSAQIKKRIGLAYKKLYQTNKFNTEKQVAETIYDEVSVLCDEL